MKNLIGTGNIFLIILLVFIIKSCKKDNKDKEATLPVLTTAIISDVTQVSAVSGGNISSDGGASVTVRGVCWGTDQTPTTASDKTTNGSGTGTFVSNLTGLTANTDYYVRAYATNSAGTSYGDPLPFTTSPVSKASLSTADISAITSSSAISGGNITDDGGDEITEKGVCWSTDHNPTTANLKTTDGPGTGSFVSNITGLQPVTTYYVAAYAINGAGTAYGDELSFQTTANKPSVTTEGITGITQTSATGGGNVTADGGASVISRGVCWSTSQNPTTDDDITISGSGTGTFSSILTGLDAGTTYYVKAYATNSAGTAYGGQINFTTIEAGAIIFNPDLTYGSVSDIDGNTYMTIQIGSQTWMAENLKTTKYNDGAAIPLVADNTAWSLLSTPAYCWYDNDAGTYKATYGAIYNWYAVNTGKLCPSGWHVPLDAEWTTLETTLGGKAVAGGKLKEVSLVHWASPNTGAVNSSGFTALPGGYRYRSGTFSSIGNYGGWWAATQYDATFAWYRYLTSGGNDLVVIANYKTSGYSMRCVKD